MKTLVAEVIFALTEPFDDWTILLPNFSAGKPIHLNLNQNTHKGPKTNKQQLWFLAGDLCD